MDKRSVTVKCSDVSVEVPLDVLVRESSFFKSQFEHLDQREKERNSVSNPESNTKDDPIEGVKDASKSTSDIVDKEGNAMDTDSGDTKDESTTVNNNCDKAKATEGKVVEDPIEISNEMFYKESVRNVFEFLVGKTDAIETCRNLKLIANMIQLCQKYAIARPLAKCFARLDECPGCICSCNFTDTLAAEDILYEVDGCRRQSDELYERCLAYARANFGSRQAMANNLLQCESSWQEIHRIIENLDFDSKVTIRRRIVDVSKLTEDGPTHIIKDKLWTIVCKENQVDGTKWLGLYIKVINTDRTWSRTASAELRLINQEDGGTSVSRKIEEHGFSFSANEKGCGQFQKMEDVLNPSKGFFKDNDLLLEAEVDVGKLVDGEVNQCMSKPEKELGWFQVGGVAGSAGSNNKEEEEESEEDFEFEEEAIVMLRCGYSCVAVNQSILVSESHYFKAMLSRTWNRETQPTLTEAENKNFTVVRTFDITGHNALAVKILFEFVEGNEEMLVACTSFSLLADMLRLCDYYLISSPVQLIIDKITATPLTVDVLAEAFEAGKMLSPNERFKAVSTNLLGRCVHFAGIYLISWKTCLDFILHNKHDAVRYVFQLLFQGDEYVIRTKFDRMSSLRWNEKKFSLPVARGKFQWKVSIIKHLYENEEYFGLYLWCAPERSCTWSCHLEPVQYNLHKHTVDAPRWRRLNSKVLKNDVPSWGFHNLALWSEVNDQNNGYLKDDTLLVEIKFKVKDCSCPMLRTPENLIS